MGLLDDSSGVGVAWRRFCGFNHSVRFDSCLISRAIREADFSSLA